MQADEHLYNFCLPALTTCRSDELPNTREKLVNALAGKLEFEAWEDFGREAAALWQKMQHVLTRQEVQEAMVYIQALSRMATNPTISSGTLARIDRERYVGAECTYPERHRTYSPREKVVFKDEIATAGLFACAFAAVNLLLQRMVGTNHFRISTQHLKSEIATKADASDGSTSGVHVGSGQKEIVTQLLPDYSLMYFPDDVQIAGQTVCCFKLEGPQKNITGRTDEKAEVSASRNAARESDLVTVPDVRVVDSSEALASRLNFVFASGAEEGGASQQRSTNVNVRREDDSSSLAAHGPSTAQSAAAIACDSRKFNAAAQKSIAEGLTYALECKSGMTYVWNWGDGVALQITKKEKEDKAIVRVALVREKPGDTIGHIAKLVYFSDVAVARTRDKNVEEGLQKLKQMIVKSLENVRGTKRIEPDNEARGADGASGSEGASAEGDSEDGGGAEVQPSEKRLRTAERSGSCSEAAVISNEDDSDCETVWFLRSLYPGYDRWLVSNPSTVSKLLETRRTSLIEFGWSALVSKRYWEGQKVAVKVWNGEERGGLDDIMSEIEIYKCLSRNASAALGDAVPGFHFYWDFMDKKVCTDHKVGLVMDFVGNRIRRPDWSSRADSKRLIVEEKNGSFMVSRSNLEALRDAALESLDKLHKAGVLHGDVQLKSIRVERGELKIGESADRSAGDEACYNWRVWWIDLGRCVLDGKDLDGWFEITCLEERSRVRELF